MLSMQNNSKMTGLKKSPKPVEVPVKADAFHSEDIFMNKMAENKEYKQQKFSESSEFQNQDVNSPDLLIFMRACFILLITMCKTLNDQSLKIADISNPNFPLISYTLPTSKPLPCFVTMYERTSSCHCVQSVSVLTTVTAIMSSAGIMVTSWYRWTRLQLQKWKEKVMHWNLVNRAGANFERARFLLIDLVSQNSKLINKFM